MSRDTLQRVRPILRQGTVLVVLLAMVALFSVLSDRFLRLDNLLNIAVQTSILAIVAIGMTYALLSAGLDLSVGSVMALCGALAAGLAVRHGWGTYPAIAAALGVGAAIGLVNGLMIVFGDIPPFVATLAMLGIARGLTLVYTQGRPIAGLDKSFRYLGTGRPLGIPMPVVVMVVVVLAATWALRQTRFGLHIRAIGGNEETARLAGIPVVRDKLIVYVFSGVMAALGGVLLAARLWSAQPQAAAGFELDAIAAPVLGGTSLFGGTGGVPGTVVGAFIMGTLSNGLNLMDVPSYHQQVIKGVVFIAAVLVDVYTKRRAQERRQATAGTAA